MSDLSKDKFDVICRLCTSSLGSGGHSILEDNEQSCQLIAKKIWECLQIKVQKEDCLPQFVCSKCLDMVQELHAFREACRETQSRLRSCFEDQSQTGSTVKLENNAGKAEENTMDTEDPSDIHSSDNEDSESQMNGVEVLPELGEPSPEDYVLMKEETFHIEASRVSSSNRSKPGVLADHLVEFNNNSEVRDRDVVDMQKVRHEVLPPMWDVYEKSPPDDSGELQVIHRRYIVSKIAFPCSLCGACFKFDQGCARGSTPEARPYDCAVCHKVFPRRSSWKRHQATHEDTKPYLCRECGKGFNRKEHLVRHLLSHTSARPYNCEGCGKLFTRKEHLTRHHVSSPSCLDPNFNPLRPFCCSTCGQGFVRKEHLLRHSKRAHDVDAPVNEAEPKPFSCTICQKTFTRREHLRRHQAIHEREGITIVPVKAEVVDDEISPPSSPGDDKKSTSATCEVCSKNFSRRSHLLRHMKRIHGTTLTGQVYRCEECNKEFGRRYHLERHRRTHDKPEYECVSCGEKFDQSELLDKHMTTVHGNTVIDNYLWM